MNWLINLMVPHLRVRKTLTQRVMKTLTQRVTRTLLLKVKKATRPIKISRLRVEVPDNAKNKDVLDSLKVTPQRLKKILNQRVTKTPLPIVMKILVKAGRDALDPEDLEILNKLLKENIAQIIKHFQKKIHSLGRKLKKRDKGWLRRSSKQTRMKMVGDLTLLLTLEQ